MNPLSSLGTPSAIRRVLDYIPPSWILLPYKALEIEQVLSPLRRNSSFYRTISPLVAQGDLLAYARTHSYFGRGVTPFLFYLLSGAAHALGAAVGVSLFLIQSPDPLSQTEPYDTLVLQNKLGYISSPIDFVIMCGGSILGSILSFPFTIRCYRRLLGADYVPHPLSVTHLPSSVGPGTVATTSTRTGETTSRNLVLNFKGREGFLLWDGSFWPYLLSVTTEELVHTVFSHLPIGHYLAYGSAQLNEVQNAPRLNKSLFGVIRYGGSIIVEEMLSRGFATLISYPFTNVFYRMVFQPDVYQTMFQSFSYVIDKEGFEGLYRGVGVAAFNAVLASVLIKGLGNIIVSLIHGSPTVQKQSFGQKYDDV